MLFGAILTFFHAGAPAHVLPLQAAAAATTRSSSGGTPTLDGVKGLIRAGRFSEAERQARALLREDQQIYGVESMPTAEALDQLAEAMRNGGRAGAPDARAICERAVRIKEKIAGRNSAPYASSLHNLGALEMANGNYAAARRILREALEIRERTLGAKDPEVARSLLFLANVEFKAGHDLAAVPLVERAAAIQREALDEADPERTRSVNMLASLQYQRGDFTSPATLWGEVLSSRRKSLGADHPLVAETLHNLGALATETGDYDQALAYLDEALRVRRSRLGANNPYVAATLLVMGQALRGLGDLQGARARCEEALRIQESPLNKDRSDVAWTLRWLGDLLIQQGDYPRAKRLLIRARTIQERELGPDAPDLGWTLHSMAIIAEHEGRSAEADSLYQRSIRTKEKVYGASYPDVVMTLGRYARFLASVGDSSRAFELALQAARARVDHVRSTARGLSERQSLAYADMGSQPLDVVLAMASRGSPKTVEPAWDVLIRSRTVVLDEVAGRHGAAFATGSDSTVAAVRRDLEDARRRYANLLVRGVGSDDPRRYRAAIDRARDEVESAERTLASRSTRFKAVLRDEGIGWDQVSKALPAEWGLLAFALHGSGPERTYVAFIARKGSAPVVVPIGLASSIDPLILRLASTSGRSDRTAAGGMDPAAETACREAGVALRRRVWDPIEEHVRGLQRLFLVPEGALHLVNFYALPSAAGRYLIEDGPLIQYLSAERDLTRPSRARDGRGLLALGGAAFDRPEAGDARVQARDAPVEGGGSPDPGRPRGTRDSSRGPQPDCREFRDTRFAPLPETSREVEEVRAAWGDSNETLVLTGARAGEAALKSLAAGRRVLHLATHGFFLDATHCASEQPGTRGIGGLGTGSPRHAAFPRRSSPLLMSGLALAGANLRRNAPPDREDGILMAEEVASLDLSTAEWVVLSACDTGLGKLQTGEGVLGLRRAFEVAGAGTVIMSLWEVEDRSTREWMRHLYESRIHLKRSTPEAVRDASLAVLRDRRAQGLGTHPFYWAGFVATGDWK